ncbi:ABC transporter substrate-binding protein [Natrialbaceae archaeon A-gly3]
MDVREFPVLTEDEEELVERLSAGLGEHAGRVLAYLLARRESPRFDRVATRTAVHIGTGLSKNAVSETLEDLTAAELLVETTAETSTPGRPPKAWHATAPTAETIRRVYDRHAGRLLRQGERFAGVVDDGERSTRTVDSGEPVTVALNWEANALHLPLFAARQTDHGVDDLEFSERDGSQAALEAVVSGEADVGVAGAATVLSARERGQPVVPIAVLFQRSMVVLYTTRAAFGEPFLDLEALSGRRVGMPAGSETGLLGRFLLEQAGLEDVEVVDVTGEERARLRSGEVDVVTGMAPDPRRLSRAGEEVDVVPVADQYPVYGPTLIATRETVTHRRGLLESVLAAVTAGWAETRCDPGAAASAVTERSPESAFRLESTFLTATERFGTSDAVSRHGWGWHAPDRWQQLHTALTQGGILE